MIMYLRPVNARKGREASLVEAGFPGWRHRPRAVVLAGQPVAPVPAVNPSGGLKAKGHPIGATGVSMHVMTAMQLTGEAGDIQIANAVVVSGTHYRQILDYAKSEGIDLIIMGTGTRGQKMMFGSVADKVSRMTKIPVMLIKNR